MTQHEIAIRPAVLLSIFDHFMRSSSSSLLDSAEQTADEFGSNNEMVIGTLLGTRGDDGNITEIRSSFAVPHSEAGDQCALDVDYYRTMMEMQGKLLTQQQQQQQQSQQQHYLSAAFKGVVVVGWYATGRKLSRHVPALSDFFSKEAGVALGGGHLPIVHLLVDPMLSEGDLSIRLYQPSPIGGSSLESRYGLAFAPVEHCLLPLKQQPQQAGALIPTEVQDLQTTLNQLGEMIDRLLVYVRQVLSGEREPNDQVGRMLSDLVLTAPSTLAISDHAQFERLFQGQLQDILMTVYLSSLTKAQLAIAERLQVAESVTNAVATSRAQQ